MPTGNRNLQRLFDSEFQNTRARVGHILTRIPADLRYLTVHDLTHLDALLELKSTVAGKKYKLNPAENFVFRMSVLFHDAGMCLAAYPGGLDDLKKTPEWQDACTTTKDHSWALFVTLRQLHARHAESLPELEFGEGGFLIENSQLRDYYATAIGKIAHSHNLSTGELPAVLGPPLNPLPEAPDSWTVDPLEIACLLRCVDAAHIDARRAPRFLRSIVKPAGMSDHHWNFQSKLGKPILKKDYLVFGSGAAFKLQDSEAWWLCYDTARMIDRELRDANALLEGRGLRQFAAKRVYGIASPEHFADSVRADGWLPVNTELRITNVPGIVQVLGGSQLYGDKPDVSIRELIQNAADAVRARRILENRGTDYGQITVAWEAQVDGVWLHVEDNGVGMSERTMTTTLLDFGRSFWSSGDAQAEYPGLMGQGMKPTGRFGIGFYSVFIAGDNVKVVSRRFDREKSSCRTLEFRNGISSRPILRPSSPGEDVLDGGTRVSVRIPTDRKPKDPASAVQLISRIAPVLDVTASVRMGGDSHAAVKAGDWRTIAGYDLLRRLGGASDWRYLKQIGDLLSEVRNESGEIVARATLAIGGPSIITAGGLATDSGVGELTGVFLGGVTEVTRSHGSFLCDRPSLIGWAAGQVQLLSDSGIADSMKFRATENALIYSEQIAELPFARAGSGDAFWGQSDLIERLRGQQRVIQCDESDLTYDEWADPCKEDEFEEDFEPSPEVICIHSRAVKLFEHCLRASWGEFSLAKRREGVGTVEYKPIERYVRVYSRV